MQNIETVKENIFLQKEHLLTYDYINERYIKGTLKIHTWLYDLFTGKISSYNQNENSWIVLADS